MWSAVALAVCLAAGCGGGGSSGGNSSAAKDTRAQKFSGPGGTLTIRLNADWTDFDMQALSLRGKNNTVNYAYDRLLAVDQKGNPIPYIAKSWHASPTKVVFQLRTDAKCSDGTPVTPDVVLKSFQRLIKMGGSNAVFFGAGPFKVSADDAAKTFTFQTSTPNSDLIYAFSAPYTSIVCPAGLADPSKLKTQMFGSGPYTLVSAVHGSQAVFKLRPDWTWGPKGTTSKTPGLPSRIVVKIITDDTTAANLVSTGQLDAAEIAGPDVTRLRKDTQLTAKTFKNYTLQPLAYNMRAGHVTDDEKVREALSYAVDPAAWNKTSLDGEGTTSTSFVTKTADCYDPATAQLFPKLDMAKAKQILQSDGYTMQNGQMTKDGKPLTINLLTSTTQNSGPDYVASQYKQLGVDVKLTKIEYSAYAAKVFAGDFDVSPEAWPGYTPSPGVAIAYGYGPTPEQKGSNLAASGRGDIDYINEIKAAFASSGSARCQHWNTVQEMILKRSYWLPLSAPNSVFFLRQGADLAPNSQSLEPYTLRKSA